MIGKVVVIKSGLNQVVMNFTKDVFKIQKSNDEWTLFGTSFVNDISHLSSVLKTSKKTWCKAFLNFLYNNNNNNNNNNNKQVSQKRCDLWKKLYLWHIYSTQLGCVPLGWSGSGSVIRDHSDHGRSNEPMNHCSKWIHRFIWSTITRVIPNHWPWSGSSQRNAPLIPALRIPALYGHLAIIYITLICFVPEDRKSLRYL